MIVLNFAQIRRGGLHIDVTDDQVIIDGDDYISDAGLAAFRCFADEIHLNDYDRDKVIGDSVHLALWSRVRDLTHDRVSTAPPRKGEGVAIKRK